MKRTKNDKMMSKRNTCITQKRSDIFNYYQNENLNKFVIYENT